MEGIMGSDVIRSHKDNYYNFLCQFFFKDKSENELKLTIDDLEAKLQ